MNRKFFESVEEVDKLLEEKGVHDGSIIQRLRFDKEVFASLEEAIEWTANNGFYIDVFDEGEQSIEVIQFDLREFVQDSIVEVEIRRGVIVVVGIPVPVAIQSEEDFFFKVTENKSIKFNDQLPHIIELATVVEGYHAAYGKVSITKDMLNSFVSNFAEGVVGVDLMIDYDHDQREAAGWISEVFLSFDEKTALGVVKWTPKGALALNDRSFRYFSPEFTNNYVHPHSGRQHGPTLLGGGLVNRPFLKMDAIVGLSDKNNLGVNDMDTISLKDHDAKVEALQKEISGFNLSEANAKTAINGLKGEVKTLSEKLVALEAEKTQKELEAKNDKLFSEGKINKAQLDAMNEGKSLHEILELSEHMNTTPAGKGTEDAINLSESELEHCKKFDLTPEEFVKYNQGY